MSAGGIILPVIWGLELLLKSLQELNLLITLKRELEEDKKLRETLTIETKDGNIEKVDVLVENNEGIKIGFQKQKNGQYRIISGKVSDELKEKQKKLQLKKERKQLFLKYLNLKSLAVKP